MDTPFANLALVERWNGEAWSIQPSPKPRGAIGSLLDAVSCSSSRACVAVGTFTSGARQHLALVERWNGVRWRIESVPNIAPATAVALDGVSCSSATMCLAVGSETIGKGQQVPLVLRADGDGWLLAPAPLGDLLSSVSCASRSFCIAAGGSSVERWNGARWLPQQVQVPSAGNSFTGVSCTSVTFCMVAGQDKTLRWNGRRWIASAVANVRPYSVNSVALGAISCTSAASCFGAGTLNTYVPCSGSCGSYTATTLQIEHWDGKRWSPQRTPNPNSEASTEDLTPALTGVSCTSKTACIAVGPYTQLSGIPVALAQRWNGSRWTAQDVPNPAGEAEDENGTFDAISCPSSADCIAVGSYEPAEAVDLALVEQRQQGRWRVRQVDPVTDEIAASHALEAISCTSARWCMAVGTTDAGNGAALAERWNGATWIAEPTPLPPRATADSPAELYGISCTSETFCTAVGDYYDRKANEFLLAERWDGSQWSLESTPRAEGAGGDAGAVSCASPTFCMQVAGPRTERWNGTRWTIVPTRAGMNLWGVACTSGSHCVGVGSAATSKSASPPDFVAVWNGKAWKDETVPTPAQSTDALLTAISCPSRVDCTAVGSVTIKTSGGSSQQENLGEHWNGKRWTMLALPNPQGSFLSGVSCTSARDCIAVSSGGGTADDANGNLFAMGYP